MRFFVSYSRSVKQDVGQVVSLLKDAGNEVWWDGDIPTIADWWATILAKIEWCEVFIFMISEKSVKSDYCIAELHYALARNRPILPFSLDDHTQYTIPEELGRRQWFIHNGDAARMLAQIIRDCKSIDLKKYADTPTPRPAEPNTGARTLTKQFQHAVSLAENGHFEQAIKRFRNVASLDPQEWGDDCQHWVARLQLYAEIADLADHKATLERARRKWDSYLRDFDAEFDPLAVAAKLPSLLIKFKSAAPAAPKQPRIEDLLPASLVWCPVTTGKVKLETHQTFNVPAFSIAKYPVTNAHFAQFIADEGYQSKTLWTSVGWQTKEREKWIAPLFWHDEPWNTLERPVVGVSWHEAVAFCRWLSRKIGYSVALPSEHQWQRAAQGSDQRIYPWGNKWDGSRCNNNVAPIKSNSTSPVMQYEGENNGDSPYGVVDMAGNIWEWCENIWKTGGINPDEEGERILRGGSWLNVEAVFFRTDYRYYFAPDGRHNNLGFRIVRP